MIVGSLFSGAGLLDAGLHQAGHEHAWFVEREPDRRALLARRWPGRPVHDDVRNVGAHHLEPVDCIAGGFPCKGASTAGKRTGLAHPETALWAEFARIVGELRPRYVVVENVANILALHDGAVWGTVLGDLAALGFDVAWDCVPAAAFGAPHGRDRVVAIAADTGRERGELRGGPGQVAGAGGSTEGQARERERDAARRGREDAPDAPLVGHERGGRAWSGRDGLADGDAASPDADGAGREGHGRPGRVRSQVAGTVADDAQAAADAASRSTGCDGEDTARRLATEPHGSRRLAVEWGDYEPAVRRWEAIHGPAPEPLVRRLDDGDAKLQRVRSRVDRSRLSALGDGVHVYLGRLIGDALMELDREMTAVRATEKAA
jgi:DNA (cytosine-5)-methyltransferase 1